jgi:hypothetical protein
MPKRRLCGVWERMWQYGVYIASVGSLSGRCINVVRTRAALGTSRRPVVAARVRTQAGPVQTIGLHSRPDSKRVPSGPLIRPDSNRDRPDAPH